jgi:predicted transcriptional regulator|tara:strand:+ start:107 stop:406 length:300 start_codon:yes stop_codon:yes gene_type:complete
MRVNLRRSDIEIKADVLRVSKNGAGKIKIMYHTDMSHSQAQKYLWFLINQDFLIRMVAGKSRVVYYATDRGNKLLESIDHLTEIYGLYDEDRYYVPAVS